MSAAANTPSSDRPLHFYSLHEIAQLIEQKEISSEELTRVMLARIDLVDSSLQSYATVMAEHAMDAARRADQEIAAGQYKGPLHGVPIAVKDLCFTQGVRTMGGLKVRQNFVPDFDATVVKKLEEAGAVLLGKLNLTEGALSGYNPDFPIPVNPWGAELWAGVSSSGSGVATAAGLCFGCLGTDTGGSIRYPAMANGIVGLKPTYGRVSRHGVLDLAESLDHVGPMTRSVKDAAIILEAIAGHDASDNTSLLEPLGSVVDQLTEDLSGITIGVDESYYSEGTDPGLVTAIESVLDVLQDLGASLVPINMPKATPMELRDLWLPLCGYEAMKAHQEFYPSQKQDYGAYLSTILDMGMQMSEEEYQEVIVRRQAFNKSFEAELEKVDAVICPSGGMVFEVDKDAQYGDMEEMKKVVRHFQGQFTIPADLAGTPGLTVPCGFSKEGRPYTVQLLGRKFSEATLCRIGHAYEQATEWHLKHPVV